MNSQSILDEVIFQLTPTRTRYELFVVARGITERVTSGLLKPFLVHLQAVEEQLAKGGYSVKLQPPSHMQASWFTKGTAERFVRFVSSPDVIERGVNIEMELAQLEETIKMQTFSPSRVEDPLLDDSSSISLVGEKSSSTYGKPVPLIKTGQESVDGSRVTKNSKKQLLRALEARRLVLQKEQGMAFARAAAAGFELLHLLQLIMFAECFGAARLREACCNFVGLCRKAQITGFCSGDVNLMDEDISWALSNTACVGILKSLETAVLPKGQKEVNVVLPNTVADPNVQKDLRLSDAAVGSEQAGIEGHCQQMPSLYVNLSPSGEACEWSNSTDIYQGWPAIYTDRHGLCSTFYGYHYGYSPGSQESFTSISDISPSATGLLYHSMGVTSQQSSEAQANFKSFSSSDMNPFPSLKKLQIGQRGIKKSRMAAEESKSDESFIHCYEKDSSEVTDLSPQRSNSSGGASMVFQDDDASRVSVKDGLLKQEISTTAGYNRRSWNKVPVREVEMDVTVNKRSNSNELSDPTSEIVMPSCSVPLSSDASITLIQRKDGSGIDQSFALNQTDEAVSNVQKSQRTVSDDNSVILFEKSREGAFGSRSKKRLDFKEPEACSSQKRAEGVKLVDDCFFVCSPPVGHEKKMRTAIESELQGSQIFDKMSKHALKVNSVHSTRRDPDDLLMLPTRRSRDDSRNSCDVLDANVELRGSVGRASANLPSPHKKLIGLESSQDRVKKFLDQYNEKREAKLRGDVSRLKRAETEGKLKTMKDDLDKRRSDLARPRRPERASLQAEAQLRAEKLRMYKADLQRSKKEKEEEERRRLEELKAQRQARIAARSNLAGHTNASSSSLRGKTSSHPSSSKPSKVASRLSALPKNRTSLRDSHSLSTLSPLIARHSRGGLTSRTSPKSAVCQQSRQAERASIGSQSATKAEILKGPQRTTSPVRTNRVFSAVFGKDVQFKSSLTRKKETSTIVSRKQGVHSGFSLERGHKAPPPKAGRGTPKILDEKKQEGRTFLKKGSGGRSSSSSVQKLKPIGPQTTMVVDRRPRYSMSGMQAPRLDVQQRNKVKVSEGDATVVTSCPTVERSNGSVFPTTNERSVKAAFKTNLEVDLTTSKRKDACEVKDLGVALAHLEIKSLIPRYGDADGMATRRSMAVGDFEKNHTNPKGVTSKDLMADSTVSQLRLSGRTSTANEDLNVHLADSRNTYPMLEMLGGGMSKPQSKTIVADFPELLCKQQSNVSRKTLSLDQSVLRMSEDYEAGDMAYARKHHSGKISNGQAGSVISSNGFKDTILKASCTGSALSEENYSSNTEGMKKKASHPFSFLETLRSKAAQAKWH